MIDEKSKIQLAVFILGWNNVNNNDEISQGLVQLRKASELQSAYAFGYLINHFLVNENPEEAMNLFDIYFQNDDKIAALYFWHETSSLEDSLDFPIC